MIKMGTKVSLRHKLKTSPTSNSGFGFFNLPPELVLEIFVHVPAYDLTRHCQLVCRSWREIINEHALWIRKCALENKYMPDMRNHTIPKHFYKLIYLRNPYGRNLIQNSSGEDQMRFWKVEENRGNGWIVEKPPAGADPLPFDANHSCFATSYGNCQKSQKIHLVTEGVHLDVMDKIKPGIEVSEWYAARFDCGSVYVLNVHLLDRDGEELDSFQFNQRQRQWEGSKWNQVRHVFSNYPTGVRSILFRHAGRDTQFWAGHYGSKMSEASVKFIFH